MTTFVTGFFHLLPPFHKQYDQRFQEYKDSATELLNQDINLVFYGDKEMASYVLRHRIAAGFGAKTAVFPTKLHDLELFERKDQLYDLYIYGKEDSEFTRSARFTPQYLLVILSKIFLLVEAALSNPFSTDHFVWIDYGYYRHAKHESYCFSLLPKDIYKQIENSWSTSDLFRIATVQSPTGDEKNQALYHKKYRQSVAGAIFGGSKAAINAVHTKYKQELFEVLESGSLTCEENIYGRLLNIYPELFDPYVAKYTTTLNNFPCQNDTFVYCEFLMSKFCFFGNNKTEYQTCMRLYDAVKKEKADTNMETLFNYLCISAFYIDRALYDLHKKEALAYFDKHKITPRSHVAKNLSY